MFNNLYILWGGVMIFTLFSLGAYSQKINLKGKVISNDTRDALQGVTVFVVGSSAATTTDINGNYSLGCNKGDNVKFSFIGYKSKTLVVESDIMDVFLEIQSELVDEVTLLGSRFGNRSSTTSASAIDVISSEDLNLNSSHPELTDLLTSIAPSFQSNKQAISDISDYTDPATLRGLGQDHVLVLLNGKRYHPNALINILGANPGQVSTDLNSLPSAAMSGIEILRDGASAQYGSDAIAGVMNINLNESTGKLSVNLFMGSYPEGKSNQKQLQYKQGAKINNDGSITGETYQETIEHGNPISGVGDGQTLKFDANYGVDLNNSKGEKTGFANFTVSYSHRGRTHRGDNYRGRVLYTGDDEKAKDDQFIKDNGGIERFNIVLGNSLLKNTGVFYNMKNKLNYGNNMKLYSFGGLNFRKGESSGFYRFPSVSDRVNRKLYPIGFLPGVHADITDKTVTIGVTDKIGKWDIDISYTYGSSDYDLTVRNSLNRSMGDENKFEFDVGGYEFTQSVGGVYLKRKYDVLNGLNLAFGSEYRVDRYVLRNGEEASYKDYTVVDSIRNGLVVGRKKTKTWAGASQVYPGHRPESAIDRNRTNVSAYADGELNINKSIMVTSALRYENYSDFGDVFTGKLASIVKLPFGFSIRGSISNGFRAPAMQQIYHATVTNNFDAQGVPHREGTFSNVSAIARILGIDKLKEERSENYGIGLVYKYNKDFYLTLDAYLINIYDRIISTGNFQKIDNPQTDKERQINSILSTYNSERANFFANAIDLTASGLELVLNYNLEIDSKSNLEFKLLGTYSNNEVYKVKYPDLIKGDNAKEKIFYTKRAKSLAENIMPKYKGSLNIKYKINSFSVSLSNQFYGEIYVNQDNSGYDADDDPILLKEKLVNDLIFSYSFEDDLNLSLGVNNIFAVKTDKLPEDKTLDGRFTYYPVQMGFMGRYVFLKANISL